jgi:hypothetical protein
MSCLAITNLFILSKVHKNDVMHQEAIQKIYHEQVRWQQLLFLLIDYGLWEMEWAFGTTL